ncbi:MAG: hypothetical protein ACYTG7_22090 [Planctomycetota bacterium]
MRYKKLILTLLCLPFLLGICSLVQAQIEANRLCLHNGAEYYYPYDDHTIPERAGGKYFPSFAHWAGTDASDWGLPGFFPWKIRGWSWSSSQNLNYGVTWAFTALLQASVDNPWSTGMTFTYPLNHYNGLKPHSAWPWPVWWVNIPPTLSTATAGYDFICPSTYGGFDAYFNIFAFGEGLWTVPSTLPWYGWTFGYFIDVASALLLSSNISIYENVHYSWGPNGQYLNLSYNEMDCTMNAGGNKGRNYFIGSIDNGYWFYYNNPCNGGQGEWGMCLFVEDAVTIPVSVPGSPNAWNPFAYAGYAFDVGTATVTPNASSGAFFLQIMTEDYANPGTGRVLLASSPWQGLIPYSIPSACVPFGPAGYRLPHAWDIVTDFFASIYSIWQHNINPGYPGAVWGSTSGGHSIAIPVIPDPFLNGLELRICGFSTNGRAPSASYMVTFF